MTSLKINIKKRKQATPSKVTSLHLEPLSVLQILLHNVQDGLGQPHTQQRVPYLCVAVHLFQFEEQTSGLCGVLQSLISSEANVMMRTYRKFRIFCALVRSHTYPHLQRTRQIAFLSVHIQQLHPRLD